MTYEYQVTMMVVADTQIEQKVKRDIRLLIDAGIANEMADHVSKVKFVKAKRK